MALKTSSYVILALVQGGVTSGYAIRRFIEQQRLEIFWSTTRSGARRAVAVKPGFEPALGSIAVRAR